MLGEISLTAALLFLSSGVLINAQKSAGGQEAVETVVTVGLGAPLTVECPLRVEQAAQWRLNGSAVPEDMRSAGEQAAGEGRLTARLHAAQARVHHAGVYTCGREPAAARVRVRLLAAAPPAAPPAPPARAAPASPASPAGAGETTRDISAPSVDVVYYDLNRNLSLRCRFPNPDKTLAYVWTKDEKSIEEVPSLKERHSLEEGGAVFKVKGKASEEDFGNYTCALGADLQLWEVRGRPTVRLPKDSNVVENQNIKIICKVHGKPTPRVWWTYSESEEANTSVVLATGARDSRVTLLPNDLEIADAALELRAAVRGDGGVYTCHAAAAGGPAVKDATTLRVKDMYAALWPFLGICAEVFILCAIILVYEKRRTKPELDDSDTDNHDQKKS